MSRDSAKGGTDVVGLLDIGSFKIACLIVARKGPAGAHDAASFRVVGVGHQRSRGVKAGVITDLDAAEAAVRAAVAQAERMAGVTLKQVIVSLSCGRLKSQLFGASTPVEGRLVADDDIERALAGGRSYAERDGRTLVHMNRLGFRLDGVSGMADPRGMSAKKLTLDLHAITADDAPVRNLMMAVERCYLNATGLIPSGLASAMSATTEAERKLGVTTIDIGGGSTTLAVFSEGRFIFTDTIPVGGGHLTFDIARSLQTPLAEAERIKALYGTLVGAQSDGHEDISYPIAGSEDQGPAHTTKAHVSAIVRQRFQSLLGHVKERLEQGGVSAVAGDHVVLTGGSSQLVGAAEFAANDFGRPVRVSRPEPMSGLPPVMCGPAFATVVGLLGAAVQAGNEALAYRERDHLVQGYLGQVGRWLKQGF